MFRPISSPSLSLMALLSLLCLSSFGTCRAQEQSANSAASATTDTTSAVADPDSPPLSPVEKWYRAGQFQQAAEQGLQDLLQEPWNHELRFIVADSLQRNGQIQEAIAQFQALDGTPLAHSANLRLNALRVGRNAIPDITPPNPKFASALANTRQNPELTAPGPDKLAKLEKPVSTLRARVLFPKKSPALQKIDDLANKGDYEAVARQGLLLLAQDKNNAELRLLVANSLAWTGFLDQAATQYQLLLDTSQAQDAQIGLANVYRWRGQDEQALPIYKAVLARSPKNPAALEGLRLAERELAPRSLITAGAAVDSSDAKRRSLAINHRWRDSTGRHVFEVELGANNDQLLALHQNERDVVLRYQALGLPLQPKLEIAEQYQPNRVLTGSLRLHWSGAQNYVELGRLDWGKLASNAKALKGALTADHVGAAFSTRGRWGELSGKVDHYNISDGNDIFSSGLRFVPAWRPLGSHVKLFTGIETRDARKGAVAGSYWAPVDGYGTGYVGLQADWGGADWSIYGAGQVGARLYGEAGNSWSLSAGGKWWLGSNYAVGLNMFGLGSRRDNAGYRAKAVNVNLEKLWN
jgi:tetratricopeptide (TPR) repeat protein